MNPVAKYKHQMENLLDTVMNSINLDDPALEDIIEDEEQAQMVSFVSKAFATALRKYKERQNQGPYFPPGPMGFRPMGPPFQQLDSKFGGGPRVGQRGGGRGMVRGGRGMTRGNRSRGGRGGSSAKPRRPPQSQKSQQKPRK